MNIITVIVTSSLVRETSLIVEIMTSPAVLGGLISGCNSNGIKAGYVFADDAVALLVGHRTCDLQVAGSSPGWAPLCSDLGQTSYTHSTVN